MTSKKKARRHRGSNRQVSYARGGPVTVVERELSDVEKVIDYWRGMEHRPLFVYFITEAPALYDRTTVYTLDECDEGINRVSTRALRAVKIGKAFDPLQRLRELGCGNPRTLRIEHVILANERTERWLHQHWGGAGIKGEWYGNNYFDAILATAEFTSKKQIEAHKAGENMHYITELLPQDVATNKVAV